ncbi:MULTISPECIES: TnsD family transposase [unclassified Nostoc]|uniref:TnsD family transposase n=1 Tax=unclassified Nostoc TaxID=2593658 RepID=UPI001D3B8BBD|nr:TnsD family transposase [Nostoc sp. JL23]MBN3879587.1 TniQ family protein [Nostoc sp. JL23]
MLGYFPEPYPDELLYSICARFQYRLNYPSQRLIIQDLFQTKNAIAIFDLPSRLHRLVTALPPGCCYTVDYFIQNHTLLPFYSPFLPPERLQLVREDMCGDNGSKIHTRLGIVAGFIEMPSHLRFCPVCMEDDRKQFGECYWHRLHQLPGVEVCSTHGVFLEKSVVLTHNRRRIYEFTSAEQAIKVISPRPIDPLNSGHKILLKIARDIDWLLNNCRFVPDLEALYQKYLSLVKNNPELVTYTGRIRVQELLRLFKNYYPSQVLDWLQCPLDEKIRDNWLAQLVRFPKRVHHPLRHLLFIHFLGYTAQEFFELKEAPKPFGHAPWRCLNPVCKYFKKPHIKNCQITYNQENHKPTGIFSCTCGFVYSRIGPDESPEDHFRFSKIKVYGSVWEEYLKTFWEDSSLTLKEISQLLGVEVKTVLRQADRLKLTFPRPNTKARATELCPSLKPRAFTFIQAPDVLESCRQQWLELIEANPEVGRTQLRSKAPAIYAQLYKYDKNWLLEHLPPPITNNGTVCVDWNRRGAETVEAVKIAAQRLKQDANRPIWISKTAIANSLTHPASAWVKKHLKRLPKTAEVLAELSETREEFAARRVQWAADSFRQENIAPQRWQLVRRAGLRPQTRELRLVKQAIATALDSFNL